MFARHLICWAWGEDIHTSMFLAQLPPKHHLPAPLIEKLNWLDFRLIVEDGFVRNTHEGVISMNHQKVREDPVFCQLHVCLQ